MVFLGHSPLNIVDLRLLQPLKQSLPISFTDEGMVILAKAAQL